MMVSLEHKPLWNPTSGGNSLTHERDVNAEQPVSRSCTLKLGMLQEGNRSGAVQSHIERQELLWRRYFLDPTLWWDWRQDENSSRSPDFKHEESKEALWLDNFYKPAGVDAQLIVLDDGAGVPAPPPSRFTLPTAAGHPTVPDRRGDVTSQTVARLCEKGQLREAVGALSVLVRTESRVSTPLLYSVLKTCVAQKNMVLGRRVHELVVEIGYESNTFLGNHILRMYASQGMLQEAMGVFRMVATPDAFMWSSIVSAYAKHGEPQQAIQLYKQMRGSGVKPDGYVFVAALQACASAADLESGRQVHSDLSASGVPPDLFVWNCLVDMYAKCAQLEDARRVFDSLATRDVVTWNTMLAGYAEHGSGQEALALYAKMDHEGFILADRFTFACLLKACASLGALQQGKHLHSQILERGQLESDIVVGNCLVDMYAKCGELEEARRVFDALSTKDVVTWNTMIAGYAKCGRLPDACRLFDSLPAKNVVTWNAMIAGYADHGLGQEALALYARMENGGHLMANRVTFACLLKVCGRAGALQQGKQLHSRILERGLLDVAVGNSLVEMYAKCGKMEDAQTVFNSLPTKDAVTWNVLINGYGQSSESRKAIYCFQEMLHNGIHPEGATFTCLLAACSHDGLVNEGRQYFKAMVDDHGVMPTIEHYTCMVDLLGRAGHLDEAENMLLSFESNDVGFMSLLNACKSHRDIERGMRCFESLIKLDPQKASAYVLMANIYADAGRWTDVKRIERVRKVAGASKKPAVAGIEVKKQVHTFVVGERRDDISCKIRSTNVRLKEEGGYVPHTNLVLKPLSEKKKEDELCGHAEKLALAYGLLNTPNGAPLLVTKNLRMCRDCHSSTEIMSRIEKRDIVVRDAYRVHRFQAGSCSCMGRP